MFGFGKKKEKPKPIPSGGKTIGQLAQEKESDLSLADIEAAKTGSKKPNLKRQNPDSHLKRDNIKLKTVQLNEDDTQPTKKHELYLNTLCHFPKKNLPNHILNFRQLLYLDLLKDPNEPQKLESAFMTTYGFESDLLLPIVSTAQKIKVSISKFRGSNLVASNLQ